MTERKIQTIWEYDNFKLIFSDPHIQELPSVVYVKDISEAMHYYYTVTAYKKKKKKWKKIITADAYDFPALPLFGDMLTGILSDDFTDGSWQIEKRTAPNQNTLAFYSKAYTTEDRFNEDYYSIMRNVVIEKDEKTFFDKYVFTFGSGTCDGNAYDNGNLASITLPFLRKHHVESLKNAIDAFIQQSIEQFNDITEKRIKKELECRCIKNGKLVVYCTEDGKEDEIEEIYKAGDTDFDITTLESYQDKPAYCEFRKCRLDEINKDSIKISDGYVVFRGESKKLENAVEIPINKIVHSFRNIDNEDILAYNAKQCRKELEKIMTAQDKQEFCKLSKEERFRIWGNAMASRTWMYRTEHQFKDTDAVIRKELKKLAKKFSEGLNSSYCR